MSGNPEHLTKKLLLLEAKAKYIRENMLEYYDPYPFQVRFHNDKTNKRALQAANQIGKSVCGCAEDAYHLTGEYPEWWEGHKYERPIRLVCGGVNNDKTRDLLQKQLFGDPVTGEESLGTGWVQKRHIGKISKKRGVSDAFMHVKVAHHTNGVMDGWSTVTFLAYEMGKASWMGDTIDIFHLDEEPPAEILSQAGRGCIASGGIIYLTYTPENGITEVVKMVEKEWGFHKAEWADVAGGDFSIFIEGDEMKFTNVKTLRGKDGHLTEAKVKEAQKAFPPYMMKMRAKGIPVLGSGLVFILPEDNIKCDPMSFPPHWKYVDAIDFGGLSSTAHPTAFVRLVYDPENDVAYIYDGFRLTGKEIPEISSHIRSKPNSSIVPVIWPHDGNKMGQGGTTKEQYLACGVNMFKGNGAKSHFTNPPESGKEEGSGGIQIMPGITEMSTRLNDGRMQVMSTVIDFFEEYRQYHMKDGKIVDVGDDFMSAARYALMSIRHAVLLEKKTRKLQTTPTGNWLG